MWSRGDETLRPPAVGTSGLGAAEPGACGRSLNRGNRELCGTETSRVLPTDTTRCDGAQP